MQHKSIYHCYICCSLADMFECFSVRCTFVRNLAFGGSMERHRKMGMQGGRQERMEGDRDCMRQGENERMEGEI